MRYNILDYGAKKDTICTENIQLAIDECSNNGGGVVVIPGGEFISGTVWLKSNVELHLQTGATLKASVNMDDYNADDAYPQNWGSVNEKWKAKHLIIALECDNVAITGNGIIDGSGDSFFGVERVFYSGYAWDGGYVTSKDEEKLRPGQLICLIECTNVKVSDITIKNMPCWGVFFHGCEYVQTRGIKIINPFEYVNTDGIDVDCCRYVTISDCIIITGDDAIAIRCDSDKLKNPKVCENITITNCTLASNSSVFRIGVGVGKIRHVRVSNLVVSRAGNLITYATSYMGRGKAFIEDIGFSDISAYNVCRMIDCVVENGAVKNLVMKNMNVNAKGGICVIQKEDGCVSDFTLRDINLEVNEKKKPEEKYLVNVSNTNNVMLDGVKVYCKKYEWEEVFHSQGNIGLIQIDCNF